MNHIILHPKDVCATSAKVVKPYQIKHITQVLKASVGQYVRMGVLGSKLGTAKIMSIGSSSVLLEDVQLTTHPPSKLPITLVVALPRPKALRRLVSDAVAMGVSNIYIINSYRVEKSYWQSPLLQKLDDYVQLGLEQAGDTIAPSIYLKKRFKPFVEDELGKVIQGKQALLAHPYASPRQQFTPKLQPTTDKECSLKPNQKPKNEFVLVFGAEGGLITYEVDMLIQHGCQPWRLSERVLRTETAVSIAVGQLMAHNPNWQLSSQ